jgi:DUF4097 and DUF4098 domain-containing protein YvlB
MDAGGSAHAWFDRYADASRGPEQVERWSKTFAVGANGSLDISNIAGTITITGGPGSEIRVDAVKRARAHDAGDAREQLAAVEIESSESAGRVEIRTNYPRRHGENSVEVDYTVQVPFTAGVAAHSVSGDVSVSKVKGEVRIESVSGDASASGTPQLLRIKSVSGDVQVADASSPDVLTAGSISGGIVARRVKARAVDMQSVSGDISTTDLSCERAQVRTVSGSVEFGGPVMKAGRYEFTSHSGDVRVGVTGGGGFELVASTFSGDIQSELPAVMKGNDEDHGGIPGVPRNREVRVTIGDGSALVTVKTFSGDVIVNKAGAEGKKNQ